METELVIALGVLLIVVLTILHDIVQRRHAIIRNFPIIGHFRFWLERVGPELRQYIVTSNDEERPFSRDQRRWVYASSKKQPNTFGFGSDNDMEQTSGYLIIKHSAFPARPRDEIGAAPAYALPAAKVLGGWREREYAFRPRSIVNVSGMSFGALSKNAVSALNRGAAICGCLQNTGEGGLSDHHLQGADLVFQIGTGYFGCRDHEGKFDLERLKATIARGPVRALEIKLSQGAKPGLGGLLPAVKVTPQIAAIRGIPAGRAAISPNSHSAFDDVGSMIEFIELLAEQTGLPVGIKSAVGEDAFWTELAEQMATTGRGPDSITIDGGEGGTGAAPLVFSDYVALPFKLAFSRVFRTFAERGISDRVVWIGSGKLGFPQTALLGFALGCDMVNVGREAMLSIGCIQAQRCQTGNCPTGVTSQRWWLDRGLDPTLKSVRLANYVVALRSELASLARACGAAHPALVTLDNFEILSEGFEHRGARDVFDYEPGWGAPAADHIDALLAALKKESSAAAIGGNGQIPEESRLTVADSPEPSGDR